MDSEDESESTGGMVIGVMSSKVTVDGDGGDGGDEGDEGAVDSILTVSGAGSATT